MQEESSPADGGSVAANPLSSGVHDNVGSVLNGLDQVTSSAEGVVDYEGNAVVVGNLGDGLCA